MVCHALCGERRQREDEEEVAKDGKLYKEKGG